MIFLDKLRPHIFGNNIQVREAEFITDIPKENGYFGAIDAPKKTDWLVDERHVSHMKASLPNEVNLWEKAGLVPWNQGLRGSCTAFQTNSMQWIANTFEHGRKVYTDPNITWDKYQIPTGASDKTGDTLQNSYLQIRKHAPIDLSNGVPLPILEFRRLAEKDPELMMRWLTMRRPLASGIMIKNYNGKSNMSRSYENGGLVDLEAGYTVGGHATPFVGFGKYDNRWCWRLLTNWGSDWGFFGDGTFLVDFEQTYKLMSATVFYEAIDIIK